MPYLFTGVPIPYFFTNGKHLLKQWLSLGVFPHVNLDVCQIVQGRCRGLMFRTEHFPADGQGLFAVKFRFGIIPRLPVKIFQIDPWLWLWPWFRVQEPFG